jgi:hypothetical protein
VPIRLFRNDALQAAGSGVKRHPASTAISRLELYSAACLTEKQRETDEKNGDEETCEMT